jgi:hypothetical protein
MRWSRINTTLCVIVTTPKVLPDVLCALSPLPLTCACPPTAPARPPQSHACLLLPLLFPCKRAPLARTGAPCAPSTPYLLCSPSCACCLAQPLCTVCDHTRLLHPYTRRTMAFTRTAHLPCLHARLANAPSAPMCLHHLHAGCARLAQNTGTSGVLVSRPRAPLVPSPTHAPSLLCPLYPTQDITCIRHQTIYIIVTTL